MCCFWFLEKTFLCARPDKQWYMSWLTVDINWHMCFERSHCPSAQSPDAKHVTNLFISFQRAGVDKPWREKEGILKQWQTVCSQSVQRDCFCINAVPRYGTEVIMCPFPVLEGPGLSWDLAYPHKQVCPSVLGAELLWPWLTLTLPYMVKLHTEVVGALEGADPRESFFFFKKKKGKGD